MVIIILALFILAVAYVCIRVASFSANQDLELQEVCEPAARPSLLNKIEELEIRLADLQDLPLEGRNSSSLSQSQSPSHCVHCEAQLGRLRSEAKQTHELLYPHLETSKYHNNIISNVI